MADTVTSNYAFIKVEVGSSDSTWGGKTNTNWDAADAAIKAASDLAATKIVATDIVPALHALAAKGTVADADEVFGADSAATYGGKKWLWSTIWTYMKSKADAVYQPLLGFTAVPNTRAIGVGGIATGGGNLSADRTITVTKSTNAQALAGADDSTAMTPLRVKDVVDAVLSALSFSKFAQSGQISIATNSSTSFAHGLGVQPKLFQACLQCVTDEFGYVVGDEVELNVGTNTSSGTSGGIALWVNGTTSVGIRMGNSINIWDKNGGIFNISPGKWKLVVRVWG